MSRVKPKATTKLTTRLLKSTAMKISYGGFSLCCLLCVLSPDAARAGLVGYSFTGTYSPYSVTISFDSSLTGASLDNLASQDITSSVSNFVESNTIGGTGSASLSVIISTDSLGNITSFDITDVGNQTVTDTTDSIPAVPGITTYVAPPEDEAGFPLGDTSDSGGVLFGSYPAFPGENPLDFYCDWNDSNGNLTLDNDAGFCPSGAVPESTVGGSPAISASGSGIFTSIPSDPGSTTPEPAAWMLMGSGVIALSGLRRFRSR
jgi:PEP-CTERM motif